mgnify:CR=1 FL=1
MTKEQERILKNKINAAAQKHIPESARRHLNKLIKATGKANLIVSLMVLHDKFGFGQKRCERFIDEYRKQLDAYNEGYIESVKDFEGVLKDEMGIEIQI